MPTNNTFRLLRNRKIIDILDGDMNFGEVSIDNNSTPLKKSMPYLSGPTICNISMTFGMQTTYCGGQSRWMYFNELLGYCIENERIPDLLSYLFSESHFSSQVRNCSPTAHKEIVETVIKQINDILHWGGNELQLAGNQVLMQPKSSAIAVATPAVRKIDREYIRGLSERAIKDIIESNFDSAITKSRTLLEEVFCYAIEKKNTNPSDSGDIGKLYGQVKALYNMHQDKETDKRINMLLSGLEKIVSAIAQMRNEGSDSHGLGAKRISIEAYHARLFVNSATTVADFILSVHENTV